VLAGADLPPPSEDLRSELKTYPQKVVFETNRDGNWELYLVNADGSSPVNLTQTLAIDELYPKPSPDGTKIAYVADQGEGEHRVRDVHVMNSDGTDRVKIADNAREPCWSPDGKSVAYLKGEFEKYNLQDFATRGVYIHELASGQTRQHPNAKIEHLYTFNWPVGGKWLVATVHGGMGLSHAIVAIATDGDRVVDLKLGGCRPNVRFDAKKITWGHGDFYAGVADLDLTADTPKATNIHNIVESTDPVETYHVTWSPYRRPASWPTAIRPSLPASSAASAWAADVTSHNARRLAASIRVHAYLSCSGVPGSGHTTATRFSRANEVVVIKG